MKQLFDFDLKKISTKTKKEDSERKKNLELFLKTGLPNKKNENWKFTDLNSIINQNFENITNNNNFKFEKKIDQINDFDHNHILLVNGMLKSSEILFPGLFLSTFSSKVVVFICVILERILSISVAKTNPLSPIPTRKISLLFMLDSNIW